MDNNLDTVQPEKTDKLKKTYQHPTLIEYGDIREITQNQGTIGDFDNPSKIQHKTGFPMG